MGRLHEKVGLRIMIGKRHQEWTWWIVALCALVATTYFWRSLGQTGHIDKYIDKASTASGDTAHIKHPPKAPPGKLQSTISPDGLAAVPAQLQIAHVSRVRTARSYQEWLVQFPPDERAKIEAFNKTHFGIYRVNSREQVAWMAANAYPMPEDIVAAEQLSDRELLKLAKQGNDKATFLLKQRQDQYLADFLAKGGEKKDFYGGAEGSNRIDQEMAIDRLIKLSNSPYKGYLQAQEAISGINPHQTQSDIDVQVIAGLLWAENLGDFRAAQLLTDYVGQNSMRSVILYAATRTSLNLDENMSFMARSGGRRPQPVGGSIPGGFAPVQ